MKLKPREKRERLFKKGRPIIRQMEFLDGDEYHKDVKVAWVAHSKAKFYSIPDGATQDQFVDILIDFNRHAGLHLVDDFNSAYKEGIGPVGIVQIGGDDWRALPHVEFFPWATARNILRCTVSFLHMMKYKKIGVCVIYALKESVPLFDKCTEYGVLFKSGMIAGGSPRGDEYIYSIRGKR